MSHHTKHSGSLSFIFLSFGLYSLVFLSSCSKHDDGSGNSSQQTTIYFGGLINSNGNYSGASWKVTVGPKATTTQPAATGSPTVYPNTSRITSVVLSGSDVYMSGTSTDNIGRYFRNGTPVTVNGATQISFIAVSGNNIYGLGFDKLSQIAYWINQQEYPLGGTLPTGGSVITPFGIAVFGGDVYAAANASFQPRPVIDTVKDGSAGLFWKNGQLGFLVEGGYGGIYFQTISGMAGSGNDVYFSGNNIIDTLVWSGYWKDGNPIALDATIYPPSHVYYHSTGMAVSGTDVYVTGTITTSGVSQAVYWKNGDMKYLQGAIQTYNIALSGTDIYILGEDNNGNTALWKNGTEVVNFGQSAFITSMAIAK